MYQEIASLLPTYGARRTSPGGVEAGEKSNGADSRTEGARYDQLKADSTNSVPLHNLPRYIGADLERAE